MKILLVEPNYSNKYPPLGLMKISSYHKSRGDFVYFYKGEYPSSAIWDRIYITTLFTFDYKKVLKTISYYKDKVKSLNDIYIGGIMASLMTEKLMNESGITNILRGVLSSSSMIGFDDNINIDELPLDYDLLYNANYSYPAGDNFIGYTSRCCVNKCKFCAVPKLEPEFKLTNNIVHQFEHIRNTYGNKRHMLLLDNNILGLNIDTLDKIVTDLNSLGFTKQPTFVKDNEVEIGIKRVQRLESLGYPSLPAINNILEFLNEFKNKKMSAENAEIFNDIIHEIYYSNDDMFDCIVKHQDELIRIINTYAYKKKLQRYVDFNQGMDARLLTEEKMKILSRLEIRPFRIAFDDIKFKETYEKALRLAHKYGVKEFSNYILYNYNDTPDELWERLHLNIKLAEEFKCHIFSFPMKYAPIDMTDRKYIGKHWNRYYLSSIHAILNVTKGIVARNKEFFYRAYGKDINEFYEIISMPRDFITYRNLFEEKGLTAEWKQLFKALDDNEKQDLITLVSTYEYKSDNPKLNKILPYYKIKKESL